MNTDVWRLVNDFRIDKCKLYIQQKRKKRFDIVIDQLNRIIYQHNHYLKYNELLHRLQFYPYLPILILESNTIYLFSTYRNYNFSFNVLFCINNFHNKKIINLSFLKKNELKVLEINNILDI